MQVYLVIFKNLSKENINNRMFLNVSHVQLSTESHYSKVYICFFQFEERYLNKTNNYVSFQTIKYGNKFDKIL